jgi:tripartite-type tricarboxylate transporter receptor subunit TctC
VENKPGAAGAVGAEFVKNANPDGHTLLIADNAVTAINKYLRADLPYDPVKDFVPVTEITSNPFFLYAGNRLGVNSAGELIALLKSKPGQLNYGSAGDGSLHHLCTALFLELTGTNATHVQYRTSGDMTKAMVAEEVEIACGAKASGRQMINSGKAKPIAVALERPNPLDTAVPTLKQQTGTDGFEIVAHVGLMAPAGTPRAIVDQLARDVAEVFRTDQKAKELVAAQDAQTVLEGPEAYAAVIRYELDKFARIVKAAGAGGK